MHCVVLVGSKGVARIADDGDDPDDRDDGELSRRVLVVDCIRPWAGYSGHPVMYISIL